MIVKLTRLNVEDASEEVKFYMRGREDKKFRLGMLYPVYAIFFQVSVQYLLVVDDRGLPEFLPAYLFDNHDTSIPSDWKIDLSSQEPEISIGPEYIIRDPEFAELLGESDRRAVKVFLEKQNLPDRSNLL